MKNEFFPFRLTICSKVILVYAIRDFQMVSSNQIFVPQTDDEKYSIQARPLISVFFKLILCPKSNTLFPVCRYMKQIQSFGT